jgi:DDE superfamily endonuclease
MEEVLDVYELPYDPKRPQICMDELPKQLLAEKYEPLPGKPGQLEKQDYEYERHGTANLFLLFEPLAGKRFIETNSHRTSVDWAHVMKTLADVHYPQAEVIVLVMDNLNTHKLASFYEAFEPEEAHRLSQRFEIHFTPKHGSWLNMAEIELGALARQCLDRRIPNLAAVDAEAQAWAKERNEKVVMVDWRFTTADARIKLKHLYPKIQA